MICGDLGFKNKAGGPCSQNINAHKKKPCLWHSTTPEQRKELVLAGQHAMRNRAALPADFKLSFQRLDDVISFAEGLSHQALKKNVDRKRIETAVKCANLAMNAHAAKNQESLLKALLTMEHGGIAAAIFARLKDGVLLGSRKPIPAPARLSVDEETHSA